MKTHFFSLESTNERYPPALVLELKEYMQKLQEIFIDLGDDAYSIKWAAETILISIQYEREAMFQLGAELAWVQYETAESNNADKFVELTELLRNIGEHLFETLKSLGAYSFGYLPYQYHGTLRSALILMHLGHSEGEPQ